MLTVTPISSDAIILLPCSLALCSAVWQVIKSRSQWSTKKGKLKTFKFGVGAFFAAAGASLLFFMYEVTKISSIISFPDHSLSLLLKAHFQNLERSTYLTNLSHIEQLQYQLFSLSSSSSSSSSATV